MMVASIDLLFLSASLSLFDYFQNKITTCTMKEIPHQWCRVDCDTGKGQQQQTQSSMPIATVLFYFTIGSLKNV